MSEETNDILLRMRAYRNAGPRSLSHHLREIAHAEIERVRAKHEELYDESIRLLCQASEMRAENARLARELEQAARKQDRELAPGEVRFEDDTANIYGAGATPQERPQSDQRQPEARYEVTHVTGDTLNDAHREVNKWQDVNVGWEPYGALYDPVAPSQKGHAILMRRRRASGRARIGRPFDTDSER